MMSSFQKSIFFLTFSLQTPVQAFTKIELSRSQHFLYFSNIMSHIFLIEMKKKKNPKPLLDRIEIERFYRRINNF
jgi:hypothetical protein